MYIFVINTAHKKNNFCNDRFRKEIRNLKVVILQCLHFGIINLTGLV